MSHVNIKINNVDFNVPQGISVIQACEKYADIFVPRFCYHEKLKVAGNCRMCLVEIKPGPPKPAASCSTIVANGMEIFTDSDMVHKARNGVMEFLLANHPLDCPVCDQGGECDLQDQAYVYGKVGSRFEEAKRVVQDKYMGPLIATHMTRCIHCTRCIRFATDIAGAPEIGAVGRGEDMEITTLENAISSELSGNVIDLCPVGALTSKPGAAKIRAWESKKTDTIDVLDPLCPDITLYSRGKEVFRVVPKLNENRVSGWINDRTRFAFDGLKVQRLDISYIRKSNDLKVVSLRESLDHIHKILYKSKNIGIVGGSLCNFNVLQKLKVLSDKFNSKVSCTNMKIDTSLRENYLFNMKYEDISKADLILIISSNIKKDSPVLNAEILAAVKNNNANVYTIGSSFDLNYKTINIGNNSSALIDLYNDRSIATSDIKKAKFPIMIVGEDALEIEGIHTTTLAIANKMGFIRNEWNGYCMLHKNTSNVSSLEAGFYNATIREILELASENLIDTLILYDTYNIKMPSNFQGKCIYFGTHGDNAIRSCDVIVPVLSYVEEDGIYFDLRGAPKNAIKAIEIVDPKYSACNILDEIIDKLIDKTNMQIVSNNTLQKSELNLQPDVDLSAKDYNFYMRDQVSYNSQTMANCCKEILKI